VADATMPATTRGLADFIMRMRYDDLPEVVQRESTRAFLNWVGCALSGCRHSAVAIVVAAAEEFSGRNARPCLDADGSSTGETRPSSDVGDLTVTASCRAGQAPWGGV
jgi:2-methylcitrate dehydratase PrpD